MLLKMQGCHQPFFVYLPPFVSMQGLTQLNMLDIDSGGIDDGDFRSPP